MKGLSFSLAQDFAYNYLSTTLQNNQYPERFTYLTAIATHYKSNRFSTTASLLNTYITENVRTGKAAADRKRVSGLHTKTSSVRLHSMICIIW